MRAMPSGELDSNETSMYQDMFDKQVALTLEQASGPRHRAPVRAAARRQGIAGRRPPGRRPCPRRLDPQPSHPEPGPAPPRAMPTDGAAAPSTSAVTAQHAAQFVEQVLPTIQRAARMLGINPLGLLAQAALETGWGQRMPRTADGSPSLNLFGVKAGEEWSGARAVADTVEFSGGVATQRRTAFRAYGSIEESVSDFANLLANSPRYREAIAAGGNVAGVHREHREVRVCHRSGVRE